MKFKIIGAVIIAVAVVVLLLLPGAGSMEKYEDMYQRGHYSQVSRNLLRELERKPKWHEARKLLIKAELKENRLESAVFHLLALEEDEISISSLALSVDEWLQANKLSQAQAEPILELLSRRLEAKAASPEIYLLYLKLVAEYQDASQIPASLKLVMEAPVKFVSGMVGLINQAFHKLALTGDIETLWDTGIMLDNLTDSSIRHSYILYWRRAIMQMAPPADLDSLREKHPGDAYLAINHAFLLEPAAGLEFLRGWERLYAADDSSADYYSQRKLALLQNADSLDQADFNYLNPNKLLNLALTCTDQPAKCKVILDWLEQLNFYPDLVQTARAALKGPQPCLRLPGFVISISPDGEKIVRAYSTGIYLCNIRGEETKLPSLDSTDFFWASDSSTLALHNEYNGDTQIYRSQKGICRDLDFGGQVYKVLGWHDPTTLWILKRTNTTPFLPFGPFLLYNIETGEIHEEESVPHWAESLFPGPKGALAWGGRNKFQMLRGGKILEVTSSATCYGWIPDGRGLILDWRGQIRLWTGGEIESTEVEGRFLGWRNDRVFYWAPESMEFGVSKLMGYDLKTGEIIDYQLLGYWTAAAGKIAVAGKNYYQLLSSYADDSYYAYENLNLIYFLP